MVPEPCVAVILLFPITENVGEISSNDTTELIFYLIVNQYEAFRKTETERIEREGQKTSDKLFYMRQTIRNACGTYAVLHSLVNNRDRVDLGREQTASTCTLFDTNNNDLFIR